jgi:hypothetical protein
MAEACLRGCPGSRIRYRAASIGPSFRRHKASSDGVNPAMIGCGRRRRSFRTGRAAFLSRDFNRIRGLLADHEGATIQMIFHWFKDRDRQ